MAVANENAVKYASLPDEIITDYKEGIELFVKSQEYWDKFAHHSTVPQGHRKYSSRRLIRPRVKPEDIKPSAEFIAPRPTKIAVATFEKSVEDYDDKAIYSREDVLYHLDDTVENIRLSLQEIAVQKRDLIKGAAFVATRATVTYDTSLRNTLRKASKILRKNHAKRWDGKHWLVHMTLEEQAALRAEIDAASEKSEKMRLTMEGVDFEFDVWEDWIISVPNDEFTLYKSDSVHYMVLMGKRGIDGESPVDVSKLEGTAEFNIYDNGLGGGVIQDVDGNYTTDDNKQQGSVGITMLGLGANVSDDLSILLCEVSVNTVHASDLAIADLSGYVSHSGNEIEITASAGTKTHFVYKGARIDTDASKVYASGNTIISVQVVADEGEAFSGGAAPTSSNWTATYKNESGGDSINAEILAVKKTAVNYDTLIVMVPNNAVSFTVASTATAD